jgi:hypothetical protein
MLVDDEYFPARCCFGNRMRIVPWFAAGSLGHTSTLM